MSEVSEKETRLTEALKKLTPKELEMYRYFLKENQAEISEESADKLYDAYFNGSSCYEIYKTVKSYSYSQIVAARVMYDWDNRKLNQKLELETNVPSQAGDTLLAAQDFLGDLIVATGLRYKQRLKGYIATKDTALLEGLPLPKSMKEIQTLVELFMKASGKEETTKNINVNVKNEVVKTPILSIPEDKGLESALDELLGIEPTDAEFVEVKQLEPKKENESN
ncbi:MAG TPA: hypothetical protein VHD33_00275 [Legionellaceae bacterium]|nr:hypothetical protein [Legionellaceae bacterium]